MNVAEAVRIARVTMDHYGLEDWEVVVTRARTQAGVCRFDRKQIGLSRPLTSAMDEHTVRDTILHEIAHALVGPKAGHGPRWQEMALAIGCTAQRCFSSEIPAALAPWTGTCPAGHTVHRHRRPSRVVSCRQCGPVFSAEHLFAWTKDGQPAPMLPRYVAEYRLIMAAAQEAAAASGAAWTERRRHRDDGGGLSAARAAEC